jgi:ketosteroid isomerase-like protein
MSVDETVAIVLEAFRAVEQRDDRRLNELYHPEVEFHWPGSLPFGGSSRGPARDRPSRSWSEVRDPLQVLLRRSCCAAIPRVGRSRGKTAIKKAAAATVIHR